MANPVAIKDTHAGDATSVQSVQSIGALVIMPQNFGEVERFADKMAASRFVPAHLRDRPADCLAVALQALRWGMDPFAVAQKTYFTRDGGPPAYEAQLVNAVILSRAPLVHRPDITWIGAWPNRICTVSALLRGDKTPKIREVKAVNIKTRNSPLWVTDPDQQIAYYTTRAWARLYCPDVLMGVYTPDDEDWRAETATDITPASEQPRPSSRLDAMEDIIEAEQASTPAAVQETSQDYDHETGEVRAAEPAGITQVQAESWANRVIGKFDTVTDAGEIDRWLANNQAKLGQVHTASQEAAMAVVSAAEGRKKQLDGGGA